MTEGRLTLPRLPTMAAGDFDEDGREEVVVGLWNLYLGKDCSQVEINPLVVTDTYLDDAIDEDARRRDAPGIDVAAVVEATGYTLEAFIPAECLGGFDPKKA